MIPLLLPVVAGEYDLGMANLAISKASAGWPCQGLVITDEGGKGFTQAFNRGIRSLLSKDCAWEWDCVCVLSGDLAYLQQDWLRRMREVMFSNNRFGFVGPSVKCGTNPQRQGQQGMLPFYEVVQRLSFTGVLIRREVVETIGLASEDLFHYGVDYDYVHRSQEWGWQAVWVHDVWCEHDWNGRVKYPELAKVDQPLYYSRWTRKGKRRGN